MAEEVEPFTEPKIAAYSVADGHPYWLVPCVKCNMIHLHGAAEGHRLPHCPTNRRTNWPDGYVLQYAGQADEAMLRKVFGKRYRASIAELVRDHARAMRSKSRSTQKV